MRFQSVGGNSTAFDYPGTDISFPTGTSLLTIDVSIPKKYDTLFVIAMSSKTYENKFNSIQFNVEVCGLETVTKAVTI